MAGQRPLQVTGTWSIDTSARSILAAGVDLLASAMSDDVQPLAVLACEKYGATLAMCSETSMKIERLAKRHHNSFVLNQLGIKLGFMPQDVADQLSNNEAGGKKTLRSSV